MDVTRETVRRRYAEAAIAIATGTPEPAGSATPPEPGGCCGDGTRDPGSPGAVPPAIAADPVFGAALYDDTDGLPTDAVAASLGCGNPTAVADLHPGETVLDLGSGAGIDVLLSARRVGQAGHVYGLDMTEEMLDLARANAATAGADNVEFLHGVMEDIPLPDGSIDVVISNCVVNLSTDKPAVFAELARVLRPGGRIGISDVVAADALSPAERAQRGDHVGCIAGALSFSEYAEALHEVGLVDVTVTPTHEVVDGMYAAIIRGVRAAG